MNLVSTRGSEEHPWYYVASSVVAVANELVIAMAASCSRQYVLGFRAVERYGRTCPKSPPLDQQLAMGAKFFPEANADPFNPIQACVTNPGVGIPPALGNAVQQRPKLDVHPRPGQGGIERRRKPAARQRLARTGRSPRPVRTMRTRSAVRPWLLWTVVA